MHLVLKWLSKRDKEYSLGILFKENNKYIFEIDERELKLAMRDGCMGIGNFELLKLREESVELFDFFKNRIPKKDSWKINDVLKKYKLKEYDEMHLLLCTEGRSINDRYWVEQIK